MRKVIGGILILGILAAVAAPALCADPSPSPSEKTEILHHFIVDGKLAYVENLLHRHPELVNNKLPVCQLSPLHSAVLHNHKEIAQLLISKGADVNARDAKGKTPLTYALMCEFQEMVDLLRAHGAHE